MVSICLITYNHQEYISTAIESILMQKTNFDFEIIVGEDFSNDGTRKICEEYENQHYNKIKLLPSDKNYGVIPNFIRTLKACNGKYIAICEGDDYWIDPLKLQKQIDFLEGNPDFSLSFHNATIKWDNNSKPDSYFCAVDQKPVSTIENVIKGWFIPSASMVFRSEAIMPLPEWFSSVYNGDWALQMLTASKGKIGYLNETMSVYRKNDNSLSGGIGKDSAFVNDKKIQLLSLIDKHTNYQYSELINKRKRELEKDVMDFNLYQKNKFLYWILNPGKLIATVKRITLGLNETKK